jgi:hypothetical protein
MLLTLAVEKQLPIQLQIWMLSEGTGKTRVLAAA